MPGASPVIELDVSNDVLAELENQQTPRRITGPHQTYYVLSAEQLLLLLHRPLGVAETSSFTPADFGLTDEAVARYQAERQERLAQMQRAGQQPIELELQQSLAILQSFGPPNQWTPAHEQTLWALEAAMLHNLQQVKRLD
jgi:hypothetical protein